MHDVLARSRVAVLAVLMVLCCAQSAWAHAQLLKTEPGQNAILSAQPEKIRLSFSELVNALVVSLVAPDGTKTDLTGDTENGETLTISLPSGLGEGTHVLSWRVASVDSHPVAGSLIFSIGAMSENVEQAQPDLAERLVQIALWASKATLFAALCFGVGSAVFGLVIPLSRLNTQLAVWFAISGLLAAPISLGLHGLDALGLPLSALPSSAPWLTAYASSYASTVVATTLAFSFAIAALSAPNMRWMGLIAWLLAALAPAMSGHAGAADPQWLTRSLVALHIGGILFWTGALFPLWNWLRQPTDNARLALTRFSQLIPFAVAPLVFAGVILAGVQLEPPSPQWISAYVGILAAKLACVMLLFGLAVWNRFALTARVLDGDGVAEHRLRQSIRVEVVLIIAVLGLAAGWRFTPPPRALAQVPTITEPVFAHVMDAAAMANIVVAPGQAGPVDVNITIYDGSGAQVTPESVSVTLSAPELGVEPFTAETSLENEAWHSRDLIIPLAGTWHVALDIRMSRFSLLRLETVLEIPGN